MECPLLAFVVPLDDQLTPPSGSSCHYPFKGTSFTFTLVHPHWIRDHTLSYSLGPGFATFFSWLAGWRWSSYLEKFPTLQKCKINGDCIPWVLAPPLAVT